MAKKTIDIEKDFTIHDIELEADRVMIDPDEVHERKTKGGIIIAQKVEEEDSAKWGTIVNVGKDTVDHPMRFKVGQRVIYGKYAGGEFVHNQEEYLILRQDDIWGKLKPR